MTAQLVYKLPCKLSLVQMKIMQMQMQVLCTILLPVQRITVATTCC